VRLHAFCRGRSPHPPPLVLRTGHPREQFGYSLRDAKRANPNRPSNILEAGDYKMEDEFVYEGGTQITGGIRTLESDSRASVEGRRPLSWEELARQFAKSLEGFAKANYDRILRRRERGHPNGVP
jgi:hypothetical protein